MPTFLYLVCSYLILVIHQHTEIGCQQISGTEDITWYIKIQWSFVPSLWPWPWKQQSNFYSSHSSLRWCPIQLNLVKKGSSVQQITQKQSYMDIWALTVALTLKIANQSSCRTLWPMMMHHNTMFDYKRFSSWEDIVKMNIHWNFEPFLWRWPWHQQSNPIFSEDNPPYDDVP